MKASDLFITVDPTTIAITFPAFPVPPAEAVDFGEAEGPADVLVPFAEAASVDFPPFSPAGEGRAVSP